MHTTWIWLGDHLALDVANTVRVVEDGRQELLRTPADLASWCDAEPESLPRPEVFSELDLAQFRQARDAALQVLHAVVLRNPPPATASRTIDDLVRRAQVSRLMSTPGQSPRFTCPAQVPPALQLAGTAAAAVVDLVGRDDLANLAVCPAPGCGQFFHRGRPNQRWCSPGCGNRARVDRHRHRRQPEGS